MKLEHKYSTVSQSKRLKELGIIQGKSERYWYTGDTGNNIDHLNITGSNYKDDDMCYSAFDVAELGVAMPDYIVIESYRMHFHCYKQEQNNAPALYTVTFGRSGDNDVPDFDGQIEAHIRADLLIHLLENKLITPESVNDRLQNS